jgi:hypothetical protein
VADDDGSPRWIVTKVTGIGIDQRLIDAGKVEPPKRSRAKAKNRRARLNAWRMLAGGNFVR